jgi:hypothetical protein
VGAFMVAQRRNRVVPHRGRFGLLSLKVKSQFCIVLDVCGLQCPQEIVIRFRGFEGSV